MPGLTDWFDVFRCGSHVDRFGREVTITRGDIDRAISSYEKNSAPLVVGHPALNAPAFGWVEAFRRVGDVVQAKASSVADEFADLVKRHLYKNRSLSFGPGLRFRHVGFLGAQPPAVKGLKEIQFSDEEEFMDVEFSETALPEGEASVSSPEPGAAPAEPIPEAEQPEKDAKADGETEKPHDQPDGSDAVATLTAQLDTAKAALSTLQAKVDEMESAQRRERRRAEFAEFTGGLVKTGQLPQAQQQSVCEFMESIDAAGTYEFSEGSEPVVDRFKHLMKTLLKPVEFAEIAVAGVADSQQGGAQAYAEQIRTYRAEQAKLGRHVNASDAMAHILGGKHEQP